MSPSTPTPDTQLVRETRLHERAAVVLAADVVSGRLQPGDAFPSAEELIQRFGFSRTVAREVLQNLSMVGLVRVQHGKRTEVRPQEDWNFLTPVMQEALRRENQLEPVWRDLYDFRLVVEALAAEIRILAEDVANVHRVLAADQAFHQLIAQGSTNRILAGINRSFWDAVSVLWLDSESRLNEQELAAVAQQHQRIADAITRRDPDAAAAEMKGHLKAAYAVDVGSLSMSS
jgi:DNA-binding FadR family transcriptional regulator